MAPTSPARGRFLSDFPLTDATGRPFRLSDFKARKSLILLILDEANAAVINALAAQSAGLQQAETQAIAIWRGGHTPDTSSPAITIARTGSQRLAELAPPDPGSLAVYVADRWFETFYERRISPGDPPPAIDEILGWVEFVDYQCPECFPLEWQD